MLKEEKKNQEETFVLLKQQFEDFRSSLSSLQFYEAPEHIKNEYMANMEFETKMLKKLLLLKAKLGELIKFRQIYE
jgi:hypothetical protein